MRDVIYRRPLKEVDEEPKKYIFLFVEWSITTTTPNERPAKCLLLLLHIPVFCKKYIFIFCDELRKYLPNVNGNVCECVCERERERAQECNLIAFEKGEEQKKKKCNFLISWMPCTGFCLKKIFFFSIFLLLKLFLHRRTEEGNWIFGRLIFFHSNRIDLCRSMLKIVLTKK